MTSARRVIRTDVIAQDRASGVFDQVAARAERTASRLSRISSRLDRSGKTLTRNITLPVAAAGAASVKMAMDFESSMQQIVGLAGQSQKQVDQWSKDVLRMAKDLPQGPQALADALLFIASAGFKGDAAMRVLTASAKAAAAGLGDTTTVADAVTSAVNAYGEKQLSAAKATDILTQAVLEGKAEASSFAPVIGRVIPLASELGVSFDEVAAGMAALSRTGMKAEEGATAVSSILRALITQSPAGAKALKKVGMSYAGLRKEVDQKGLFKTLMHLKSAFKGNLPAMRAVFNDAQAMTGVLGLTGKQAKSTATIFENMKHATGATDKAFASAARTAKFKFQRSLSELKSGAIELGTAFLPVAAKIMDKVAGIARWFANLSPKWQKVILLSIGFLAVLGPLLTVLANLVTMIRLVGLTLSFLAANPVVLIIAAVVAAGVALFVLYKRSEKFRKVVDAAFRGVAKAALWLWGNVLKPVFSFIGKHWKALLQILIPGVGLIVTHWDKIKTAALWLWNSVLKPTFAAIAVAFRATGDGLKWAWDNVLKPTIDAVTAAAQFLWNNVIKPAAAGISAALRGIGDGLKWAWDNILEPVIGAIKTALQILWVQTIRPIVVLISAQLRATGAGLKWAWDNVLRPTISAIGVGIGALYRNVIKPTVGFISLSFRTMGNGLRWVWDNVVYPVISAIGKGVGFLKDHVIIPAVNGISAAWRVIGGGLKWVWDHVIKPVFDLIMSGVGQVKSAIEGLKKGASIFSPVGMLAGVVGHATGTHMAPPGYAWVGESGPELRKLRAGDQILTNPVSESKARRAGGGGTQITNHWNISTPANPSAVAQEITRRQAMSVV